MERLEDMPLRDDAELSDQESEVLREYFGDVGANGSSAGCKMTWGNALKASGYGVLLFAIFGNPWINNLFYKIPQMADNPIVVFCFKLFIFMFCMLLITKFAV